MNINLRKFKFFPSFSEETNAFTSDVYVDNVKVGEAKNDGHGGSTHVYSVKGQEKLFSKMEKHCDALPPEVYNGTELPMSLDYYIDQLAEKEINDKQAKKIEKQFTNSFVFGNQNRIGSYVRIKYPTDLVMYKTVELQGMFSRAVEQVKKKYPTFILWNNNLDRLGLKVN